MSRVDVERKVKSKKYGIILIIFILIISIFLVLLTQTDFFNVKRENIILKNAKSLDRDKIILASGLGINENIFILDTRTMEENLLYHPYIKSAKVSRMFPNKVIIKIEERTPMYVASHLGSYIYIDQNGYILDILSDKKKEDLPIVYGLKVGSFSKGEVLEIDNNLELDEVNAFIETFRTYNFIDKVTSFNIVNNKKIEFILKRGTKVAFGNLNNVQYKLSFLLEVLKVLEEREDITDEILSESEIDLTSEGEGVFRYGGN